MELPDWLNMLLLIPATVALIYAFYVLTKRHRDRKELDDWTLDTEIRTAERIIEAYIKGDKLKLRDKATGEILFNEAIPEVHNVRERRRRIAYLLGEGNNDDGQTQ